MIWLASYPRSGNTFFRIVLRYAYGLESSEYDGDIVSPSLETYTDYPVIKTHLLPDQVKPADPDIPAVYLVRDGRDAVVSLARHHQLSNPGQRSFTRLLVGATLALRGKWFGGWSRHVRLWQKRAAVTIRFEDLIEDPIACVERMRPYYDLPQPQIEKVPTLNDMRSEAYHPAHWEQTFSNAEYRKGFFGGGGPGAWKAKMPLYTRFLFWLRHGRTLRACGYKGEWFARAPKTTKSQSAEPAKQS